MVSKPLKELFDLERPLANISEEKFREVVRLLEEVHHDQPAVQKVMDGVRFRLKHVRPARKPNLQRLFYRPAEDLLIGDHRHGGHGFIRRAAISLGWNFVEPRLDPKARDEMEGRLRRAAIGDRKTADAVASELWPLAAATLSQGLAVVANDRAVRAALIGGDVSLIPDLQQLALLVSVGGAIEQLKLALPPKPFNTITDEEMAVLRRIVVDQHHGLPERAYGMLLAVMVRAAVPANFLLKIGDLNFNMVGEPRAVVMSRLGQLILRDMGDQARHLSGGERGDLAARSEGARDLVAALTAAEKVLKSADPAVRKQLAGLRATAEQAVTEIVTDAKDTVTASIKAGSQAGLDEQLATENSLYALRKVEGFAGAIAMDKKVAQTLALIAGEVKKTTNALFAKLAAKADAPPRDAALQEVFWAVRLLELGGDLEEADQVRRKAMKLLDRL